MTQYGYDVNEKSEYGWKRIWGYYNKPIPFKDGDCLPYGVLPESAFLGDDKSAGIKLTKTAPELHANILYSVYVSAKTNISTDPTFAYHVKFCLQRENDAIVVIEKTREAKSCEQGKGEILHLDLHSAVGSGQAAIPAAEREVLIALYNGTDGDNWANSTNWKVAPLATDGFSAVGTECTWRGIVCAGAAGAEQITEINLPKNHLVGALPSTLNRLTALKHIVVSLNDFTGSSIPPLAGLTALKSFTAISSNLTGPIPPLTELAALRYFWVGNNQLNGSIPSLAGLTALEDFDVGQNRLTGNIPALTGLMALESFDVGGNRLTGSIPSLTGLLELSRFSVYGNQLTGSIPLLTGLPKLRVFSVNNNQLTGSIPSLAELTALQSFCVRDNQLTGAVPAAPAKLDPYQSCLCPNNLSTPSPTDLAWNSATDEKDWHRKCTAMPTATMDSNR